MMAYVVPVYLSHEDSKGLFEGKSKKAMTNSLKVIQIFLFKEKQILKSVLKLEIVTKSLQFLKICSY